MLEDKSKGVEESKSLLDSMGRQLYFGELVLSSHV